MAPRKPDYSFPKGNYHLTTEPEGGVITAIGKGVPWNGLQAESSPLQQIIQSGEMVIPEIYIDASTPDATESVKGKLRIWGALRGDADAVRVLPFWDGRKYVWFQAIGTNRVSIPTSIYQDTSSGGNTITSSSTGFFIRFTTGTVSGNQTRVLASSAITFANPLAEFYCKFDLRNTTGCRFHVFCASTDMANNDTNATNSAIGLRFSPGVTTSYQWVYNDSVGNLNTTDSSVTPSVGTILQVYLRVVNGVYIGRIYDVNGDELDAISFVGEIPATTIAITHGISIFNTVGGAGSAVGFDLYNIGMAYK